MSEKHLHDGHRSRLREKFLHDPSVLADHEIFELLLYYAIPRKNTNPIALDLMKCFRGLSGVLDASAEQLRSVAGIGENSALIIPIVRELCLRYQREQKKDATNSPGTYDADLVGASFLSEFSGLTHERILVVGLNEHYNVIGHRELGRGDANLVSIDMRKLASFITSVDPKYLVLAHNHPSRVGLPSTDDVKATKMLFHFVAAMNVQLLDHIVYDGVGDFVAFSQSKYGSLCLHYDVDYLGALRDIESINEIVF